MSSTKIITKDREVLWRWISRGLRGVKLETIRIGGRTFTSAEALQRFFSQRSTPDVVSKARFNTSRVEEAERRLARRGLRVSPSIKEMKQ